MTSNILLINNGRILAEGRPQSQAHDEHPHRLRARRESAPHRPRFINTDTDDVRSLKFEEGAVVVETGKPDAFYALTEMAASGGSVRSREVTSPDDNLRQSSISGEVTCHGQRL